MELLKELLNILRSTTLQKIDHTCDSLCSKYGCPNDPEWKGDRK